MKEMNSDGGEVSRKTITHYNIAIFTAGLNRLLAKEFTMLLYYMYSKFMWKCSRLMHFEAEC